MSRYGCLSLWRGDDPVSNGSGGGGARSRGRDQERQGPRHRRQGRRDDRAAATSSRRSATAVLALVVFASLAAAQFPVGALAIDERQGDQYGWAVDYETAAAAQERALQECGLGCSVVLTFGRCAAYAADQDADSTAVGWAESFDSAAGARQAALSACGSRGGSGCTVRVWGCNGPGGRGGAGSEPGRTAADPAEPSGGRLRPWRCGRSVRSADAGGDSELAGGARRTVDRVSGPSAGRGVAKQERVTALSGLGGRCGY